jgi:hypothetical protein
MASVPVHCRHDQGVGVVRDGTPRQGTSAIGVTTRTVRGTCFSERTNTKAASLR